MIPRILIGVETLMPGGAESFVVRLANALTSQTEVLLLVIEGRSIDLSLLNRIHSSVKIVRIVLPFDILFKKLDGLLNRLLLDVSIRDFLIGIKVRQTIVSFGPSVIHSNQFKVDRILWKAKKQLHIRQVSTIHGDYINFHLLEVKGNLKILNFETKAKKILQCLDGIVYISDQQLRFMTEVLQIEGTPEKFRKIYNGVEFDGLVATAPQKSDARKENFVFGMVARGIPEKGWEVAIQAFLLLNRPYTKLMLVGGSSYLDGLKIKYPHKEIHFCGYSPHPADSIDLFDVGLLPSTYASESLPTSVIEYLVMGKPVIASNVGEIRNMVIRNGMSAGIVMDVLEGRIDTHVLMRAMQIMIDDRSLYATCKEATRHQAKAFQMNACVAGYVDFYLSK